MATRRSHSFNPQMDPALLSIVEAVASQYAPYTVELTSGYRPGDPRFHGKHSALDVQLVDPKTGRRLPNIGNAESAPAYQAFANAVYQYAQRADPQLAAKLRWGGYFKGGKNPLDLMHFDIGGGEGGVPMGGGSWAGGFTPEMMQAWGIKDPGQLDATMQQAGYTVEQRRNAIASIESKGSGDYNAVGKETNRQGDKPYGRYQVMASNIPSWTKQALGTEMTPEQFLASPEAQDKVFDTIFGGYVQKYGERGAAQAWFGGEGAIGKDKIQDMYGTTVKGYGDRYLAALGEAPGTSPSTATTSTDSPYKLPEKEPKTWKDRLKGAGDAMGDALANMGAMGAWKQPDMPAQPGAALAQAPAPPGAAAAAAGNPNAAELQRQKLAMVLQRLNQGTLV